MKNSKVLMPMVVAVTYERGLLTREWSFKESHCALFCLGKAFILEMNYHVLKQSPWNISMPVYM